MKDSFAFLILGAVALSAGLIWLLDPSGDAVLAHTSTAPRLAAAPADVDPELIALARELRDLERTAPAPIARQAHAPGERSRAGLPDVAAVVYPPASGTWTRTLSNAAGERVREQRFARDGRRFHLANLGVEASATHDHQGHRDDHGLADTEVWLFERNPIAPLMGTACTSYTEDKVVVDVEWPDLIDLGFGPTWNELVALGVQTSELDQLNRTLETVAAFGHTFEVYRGPGVELAWSADLHLPLYVERDLGSATERAELTGLTLGRNAAELVAPYEAHPDWLRMDLVDWREEHHGTH